MTDAIMEKTRRFFLIAALALGTPLLISACGGDDKAPEKSSVPGSRAESPAPLSPIPVPVSQETRETYQWYCAQCHGVEGKGNGINAQFLTVPPRDHTKPEYIETRSDDELFDAIKLGGLAIGRAPCMPAWGHTLEDERIRSLVRYIRELCRCEAL